jgi:hypothetical protein
MRREQIGRAFPACSRTPCVRAGRLPDPLPERVSQEEAVEKALLGAARRPASSPTRFAVGTSPRQGRLALPIHGNGRAPCQRQVRLGGKLLLSRHSKAFSTASEWRVAQMATNSVSRSARPRPLPFPEQTRAFRREGRLPAGVPGQAGRPRRPYQWCASWDLSAEAGNEASAKAEARATNGSRAAFPGCSRRYGPGARGPPNFLLYPYRVLLDFRLGIRFECKSECKSEIIEWVAVFQSVLSLLLLHSDLVATHVKRS